MSITSKTDRAKLPPRREPYWDRISTGLHIGYRVLESGTGTWIARLRADDGKQKYNALGTLEQIDDKKKYDEAVIAANAWRDQIAMGVTKTDETVAGACKNYVTDLLNRKGKKASDDAKARFRRLVDDTDLGRTRLNKLTPKVVKDWLNNQVAEPEEDDDDEAETIRRSKDSANRNLRTLKAALNLARREGLVVSDFAWAAVQQFQDVGRRRESILSSEQRKALLAKCSKEFEPFVRGLLLTGLRPGELARIRALDFDKAHGTLGISGKTGRRVVTLSSIAAEFFAKQCKGKVGKASVFLTEWDVPWNKDSWKILFREAADAAGLPEDHVLYTLRHTAISEMLIAGLSIGIVSQLCGTSPEMIGKHYGHLLHGQTREALDRVRAI
jgi:integrase